MIPKIAMRHKQSIVLAPQADANFVRTFARCLISDKHNLCYAIVPKSACSTLRRWFIHLEGLHEAVDAERTLQAKSKVADFPELSFEEAFTSIGFDTVFAKLAPHVTTHSFERVLNSFASERYFRFAVVRNPYTRIFSAWANKVLPGTHAGNMKYFGNEKFYSRPVITAEHIAENFELFLDCLDRNRELIYRDWHWTPQYSLLRPDRVAYNCIAKLEEPAPLIEALKKRLGPDVPIPFRDRLNRNPITYSPEFLTPGAHALLLKLYDEDFKAFGYSQEPPAASGSSSQHAVEEELRRMLEKRLRLLIKEKYILTSRLNYFRKNKLRAAACALRGKLNTVLGLKIFLR